MSDETLETDYLVVGAGAAGMAFADALLTHSDATLTIVDRRHAPGGHWIDAYPYVELLRRIEDVVPLGHVLKIERNEIVLDEGRVATSEAAVHI